MWYVTTCYLCYCTLLDADEASNREILIAIANPTGTLPPDPHFCIGFLSLFRPRHPLERAADTTTPPLLCVAAGAADAVLLTSSFSFHRARKTLQCRYAI